MSALIRKEVRLLLPAWLAAIIAVILPAFLPSAKGSGMLALFSFSFGALLISLSSLGQEVNLKTWSLLFSQPRSRQSLWWVKTTLAAFALLTVFIVFYVCWSIRGYNSTDLAGEKPFQEELKICGLLALLALSGGLWTMLVFRQMTLAFWMTIIVPVAIFAGLALLPGERSNRTIAIVLIIYGVAGLIWAYCYFMRAQEVVWTGGNISMPAGLTEITLGRGRTHRLIALVRKELQLQQMSIFLAAGLSLLTFAALARAKFAPQSNDDTGQMIGWLLMVLWCGAMPGMIGCAAIAEERKLGTLEGALCLPVSRKIQFAIKFGAVLLVSFVLGAVLPCLFHQLAKSMGYVPRDFPEFKKCLTAVWIVAGMSFYASSLARNTLDALGYAIAVPAVVFGLCNTVLMYVIFGTNYFYVSNWTGPAEGLILFWLSYRNFQKIQMNWRAACSNLAWFFLIFSIATVGSITISQRIWEYYTAAEPQHGAARFSGTGQTDMTVTSSGLLISLPNGRLWAAPFMQQTVGGYRHVLVPEHGMFAPKSNWVSFAANYKQGAGIQPDGTLWRIGFFNELQHKFNALTFEQKFEKIGQDANWEKVAAGPEHFLGLKNDGTLWGWGSNDHGQLGMELDVFVKPPTQIGTETNWVGILPCAEDSFAVKADGTMWRWGRRMTKHELEMRSSGQPLKDAKDFPQPTLCKFTGTNWISLNQNGRVALRSDGTAWTDSPEHFPQSVKTSQLHDDKVVQLGFEADWSEFSRHGALKRDGSFIFQKNFTFFQRKPSKYNDWLGMTEMPWDPVVLTLAADGTISAWEYAARREGWAYMQNPRGPVFSVNIFKAD